MCKTLTTFRARPAGGLLSEQVKTSEKCYELYNENYENVRAKCPRKMSVRIPGEPSNIFLSCKNKKCLKFIWE